MDEDVDQEENSVDDSSKQIAQSYLQVNHGINEIFHFELDKKCADFQGVFFNERSREFLATDANGILQLKPQSLDNPIYRVARYPKYEYNMLSQLIYYRQFNVYFAISRESSLLVLNRFFEEMVPVGFEQRNILAMIFDKARDQLITNGAYGTKFWTFRPKAEKHIVMGKAVSNFELKLMEHIETLGGSWVKYVVIDYAHDHLYYCSETDIHCYSLGGFNRTSLIFKLEGCHRTEITGCLYSNSQHLLVTCSMDAEVKLWNTLHGYLASLMGHSQGITGMHFYPGDESRIITASIDGTIRLWSLGLQECQLTVQALHSDPVLWSGMVHPRQMFVASKRHFALLQINYLPVYWSECWANVTSLTLVGGGSSGKSVRVMALCEDSSVRFYSRRDGRLLSSLLSPPDVSALDQVLDVCHSRTSGLTFILLDPDQLWVYFSKSNPACRLHAWNMEQLHANLRKSQGFLSTATLSVQTQELLKSQRTCDLYWGPKAAPQCLRTALIRCPVVRWSLASRDLECPIVEEFLLLALSDGRVLFLDPASPGSRLHLQLQAHRGPVTRLVWDPEHECLITGTEHKGVLTLIVWNLPHLCQMFEVRLPSDCQSLVRCASVLITGHASGHVIRSWVATGDRPNAVQRGLTRADMDAALPKPEHLAPLAAVDALPQRDLLVTVDSAGHAKVWQGVEQTQMVLLAEFSLSEQIASAAFLNSMGDLLVSMRRQLFLVPHRRYLPQILWADIGAEENEDGSIAESAVLEDPAVVHEGVQGDPNPVDYDSYLAPFSVKLIKSHLATSDLLPDDLLSAREAEEVEEASRRAEAAKAELGDTGEGGDSEAESGSFCSTLEGLLDSAASEEFHLSCSSLTEVELQRLIELTQSVAGAAGVRSEEEGSAAPQQIPHHHNHNRLPHFGESPGVATPTTIDNDESEANDKLQPIEPPQSFESAGAAQPTAVVDKPKPQRQISQQQQQLPEAAKPPAAPIQRVAPPPPPQPPQLQVAKPLLTPAPISLGSGLPPPPPLPSASKEASKQRQPPVKKVKKQAQQQQQQQKREKKQEAADARMPTMPAAAPASSPMSSSARASVEYPEADAAKTPDVRITQQQQQQPRRPSRSLVVEIPSLPILQMPPSSSSADEKGVARKKVIRKPMSALVFNSGDITAPAAHPGSPVVFPDAARDAKSATTVAAAPVPVPLEDRPTTSLEDAVRADSDNSTRLRIPSAKSAKSEAIERGRVDLLDQRRQLDALKREYERLAEKVSADFGAESKPLRNYGLKRLTPEELISLNNLKRMQRSLREQSAMQRKAELRMQQLSDWEARANHGDCVSGPVQADTRPPPRMRAPSSRCSQRSEASMASSSAINQQLRSQSAIEFRSAFQASREATELALTPSGSGASAEDRRAKFGALPQTPYRLKAPTPAISAAASPRDRPAPQKASSPFSAMRLRHGAASIPSRQYTYVFVGSRGPADPMDAEPPLATLAEERLIRKRFPGRVADWVGPQGVFEPKPWSYSLSGFQ